MIVRRGFRASKESTKGLLIIGGRAPSRTLFADCSRDVAIVVAADSGLQTALSLGVEPDLVVGDMDSLEKDDLLKRFPTDRLLLFPSDKDETDTEIGVRTLWERGCTEVVIAGGGKGRLDHLLAIALLFEREPSPRRWLTDKEDVRLVEGEAEYTGWEGNTVSLFPLGDEASGLSSDGLKWPLDGLIFQRGHASVSNLVMAHRLRITVRQGKLLLIRLLEAP